MMRIPALCLLCPCTLLIAGCEVSAVQADSAAQSGERVYTTGSNIGRRPSEMPAPGVVTVGREGAENALDVRGAVPLPPTSGGH